MCTVTWLRAPEGYDVFFNRDERKSRLEAHPPLPKTARGVRYLAPTDANAGGTWIAVNEYRLTLGLLNHYAADRAVVTGGHTSRGRLVLDLVDAPTVADVKKRLASIDVGRYRPFFLIAISPDEPVAVNLWDGAERLGFTLTDDELPVSTSSYDTDNVLEARRRMFEKLRGDFGGVTTDMLQAYHRSRDPLGGPYSVYMHRDDAETVSFSHVRVRADEIEFHYRSRFALGGKFHAGDRVHMHAR